MFRTKDKMTSEEKRACMVVWHAAEECGAEGITEELYEAMIMYKPLHNDTINLIMNAYNQYGFEYSKYSDWLKRIKRNPVYDKLYESAV